ncbi:MAG: type II CAAX endopeptidase family protein [Lachnospiraceae bacterium]|nr:type II CAAX endopeptidase family protein [Lachnospiraceae bacterium]
MNQFQFEQENERQFQRNPWQQEEMRLDRKHFSKIAFGLLIYSILGGGLQYLAAGVIWTSGWDYTPYRSTLNWILILVCMYLIAAPLTAAYFQSVPKFGQVRNERWELRAWLVVFFIGNAMAYFGNMIGNIVTSVSGSVSADYENLVDMIFQGNLFFTFLTVVIGAPIVEELLFRKFLIDRTIGYGEKISVLLSGILFGVMHGNFQQFFYAFALGCLFGYIYCKTGKIRNTILFHMWINFSGSILVPLMSRPVMNVLEDAGTEAEILTQVMAHPMILIAGIAVLVYVAGQFLAAVAGVVLFFVFKKYICFYPGIRRLPKGTVFRTVIVNPGMLVFFALCLLEFI